MSTVLVDSSIWIDHIRAEDAVLSSLLTQRRVLIHPFVIGEVSLGHIRNRCEILDNLRLLPAAVLAHDDEVAAYIDRQKLHGAGIGYIDAHLLVSTVLTSDASLWTRDSRLQRVAERLSLAAIFSP